LPERWESSWPCCRWREDSKATLVSSGSYDNAIIMRAGATSEMTGGVGIDAVKIIKTLRELRAERTDRW